MGMSSKPTMAMSSGTRKPPSRKALRAPERHGVVRREDRRRPRNLRQDRLSGCMTRRLREVAGKLVAGDPGGARFRAEPAAALLGIGVMRRAGDEGHALRARGSGGGAPPRAHRLNYRS